MNDINSEQYFKENNYIVVRNFLSQDVSSLLYQYCMVKTQQISFKMGADPLLYNEDWDGKFGDVQSPKSNPYTLYGDPVMDSLLLLSNDKICELTGINVVPTYSYWRLYEYGSELNKHVDRKSCEISATICLGYNVSNVDAEKFPNYNWAMFVEDTEHPDGLPIQLNPGDMILYKGCLVNHWREKFKGLNQAQVFIHYNDIDSEYKKILDDRVYPGIPAKFKKGSYEY